MNGLRIKNPEGKLVTYQQAAEKSNLGINTVMRLARESNALIKIGRIARIDWDTFYNYVTTVYRDE